MPCSPFSLEAIQTPNGVRCLPIIILNVLLSSIANTFLFIGSPFKSTWKSLRPYCTFLGLASNRHASEYLIGYSINSEPSCDHLIERIGFYHEHFPLIADTPVMRE